VLALEARVGELRQVGAEAQRVARGGQRAEHVQGREVVGEEVGAQRAGRLEGHARQGLKALQLARGHGLQARGAQRGRVQLQHLRSQRVRVVQVGQLQLEQAQRGLGQRVAGGVAHQRQRVACGRVAVSTRRRRMVHQHAGGRAHVLGGGGGGQQQRGEEPQGRPHGPSPAGPGRMTSVRSSAWRTCCRASRKAA
jgi:hypothetical protein